MFIRPTNQGEEPPDTGGGRVFSLDATSDLLATRRRLGRRGGSCALRAAFVVWVVWYEGFTHTHTKPFNPNISLTLTSRVNPRRAPRPPPSWRRRARSAPPTRSNSPYKPNSKFNFKFKLRLSLTSLCLCFRHAPRPPLSSRRRARSAPPTRSRGAERGRSWTSRPISSSSGEWSGCWEGSVLLWR